MQTNAVLISVLLTLTTLILLTLAACSLEVSRNIELEPAESVCQTTPASWQGIIPGQTTVTDVVRILGQPLQKGHSSWGTDVFIYPPIRTIPGASYGNRIGFRDNSTVDWIDVWVADLDGRFHTVAEIARVYSTTLDTVYVNGRSDLFGPDQVYVWADCGIAVTAVSENVVRRSEGEDLPLAELPGVDVCQLTFKHPVHSQASMQPRPDVQQIVFRKFLFQPTSLASFDEYYADVIPYLDKQFYKMRLAE
jgi:hypothetical protein